MLSVLAIVAPVFALIASGYLRGASASWGRPPSELNRFVVYLALPALLFDVMAHAKAQPISRSRASSPALALRAGGVLRHGRRQPARRAFARLHQHRRRCSGRMPTRPTWAFRVLDGACSARRASCR